MSNNEIYKKGYKKAVSQCERIKCRGFNVGIGKQKVKEHSIEIHISQGNT